ncbi:MAG TPA: ABC transporter ATP-binding protein [Saprospiraceae bacterium]|jgi:lipoprotein-releasing system ATP-binding protein|nr:MAG: ABC transporter [Candidatus Parvibacillus calidus]MBX2937563.1 ABC transporter ATP-binding protein [Saprospiraceae bacterium]MBK7741896.1 ABC transporter ATP-binding protein [Candidatus Parvibacillus calidus]MBX7177946.1 ABC transporter ATP-binding protein [Saprospiraceae bacterium]MCB0591953.1 ABC transporter ATP-binding protein [Saprospiraceae bacterium]
MIEAEHIHKSFGNVHVLNDVSFSVGKGEVVAIVGKSGAGKSTLLHITGTLEQPDEGNILFEGRNLNKLSSNKLSEFRNNSLGFIFQFHHLLPEFTALENVCIPAYIKKTDRNIAETRAMELLDHLNLSHRLHHKPKELSGGEQQRVAFARALINQPKLILADEPTGNLDEKSANELHDLILKFRTEYELTFILVTHSPLLAARCDRVIEMSEGSIVMQ